MEGDRATRPAPRLCRGQIDLLRMVVEGHGYREILDAMEQVDGVRARTVDMWLVSAMRTLDARTLTEAALKANEDGLLME